MSEQRRGVWTSEEGVDTVVAESAEQAMAFLTGETGLDPSEVGDMVRVPDEQVIPIWDEDTRETTRKTAAQWAAEADRVPMHLCSTEL